MNLTFVFQSEYVYIFLEIFRFSFRVDSFFYQAQVHGIMEFLFTRVCMSAFEILVPPDCERDLFWFFLMVTAKDISSSFLVRMYFNVHLTKTTHIPYLIFLLSSPWHFDLLTIADISQCSLFHGVLKQHRVLKTPG